MVNRYPFYNIFGYNAATTDLFPLYNVVINGVTFSFGYSIPRGNSFGGLDLYSLMGRDVAGIWNDQTRTLTIIGFY